VAKLGIGIAAVLAWIVPAAHAGVPSTTNSFFVPQSGTTTSPVEGTNATINFRACPNNDGNGNTASLFGHARLKVVVLDQNGNGIPGVAAADICVLFNGGTAAQGFSGIGADSVISNSAFNPNPLCPDLRCITADRATDANGETFITFAGADPLVPGVTLRNPNRKWGHYDSELPVYALGFKLSGKLTSGSAIGTYALRIKNFDHIGGLTTDPEDQGEIVGINDFNTMVVELNAVTPGPLAYWRDLNSDGSVGITDFNIVVAHGEHSCGAGLPQ
jgi:hypothetical protein